MGIKKDFTKDTTIYGLGAAIKKFIGFFLLPFYTRALVPADFGVLDTLGVCIFFLSTFLNIGIDSATGYYYFTCEDEKEKGRILFTTFILRLITVIPMVVLGFFSSQISIALFNTEKFTWVVFITCMIVPVTLMTSEQEYIYRVFRQPWKYNVLTILKSVFSVAGGILLVLLLKYGVMGAQLASLCSSVLIVVFSFLSYTHTKYTYQFSWDWAKKLIIYGYPLIGAGLALWIFTGADRFFLLHYKDLTQIGYYSIGSTFSQPIMLINSAVQMSYGVLLFSIYANDKTPDKTETKKAADETLRLYLLVVLVLATFLSVFSIEIIGIVTTRQYLPGALAIPFLAFSAIASQCVQLTSLGLFLNKKTWYYTILLIIAAIVNVILNFYFIPKYSYFGASFTVFAANFLYFIMILIVSNRFLKIPYGYFSVFASFFVMLAVSLFIPIAEFHFKLEIPFAVKCLIFIVSCGFPFIFRLTKFGDLKQALLRFKN
jgi:O-antigen/teichoic acid export membrane protein